MRPYPSAVPSPIEIVDYDPAWPHLYERESATLQAALGPMAARIEHTGSTAVPGLAAKPIVDILLGLSDAYDLDACVAPIVGIGYAYVQRYETTMPWRLADRNEYAAAKTPFIHGLLAKAGVLPRPPDTPGA